MLVDRYGVSDEGLADSATACRSTRSGSPRRSRRTTSSESSWRCSASTLSRDARARAVQLPAWNEALGLPRPWDQQWSLRMQQVLAYESDLLDYDDLFAGSHVIETKTAALVAAAQAEIDRILDLGGALAAVEGGYLKSALVQSHSRRRAAIESGEHVVVGVNAFTTTEESPLTTGNGQGGAIQGIDAGAEAAAIERLHAWREQRDPVRGRGALARAARGGRTSREHRSGARSCARAGVTTGEWASALRAVFGEYRAPTGLSGTQPGRCDRASLTGVAGSSPDDRWRARTRLRILVGKPGLDGHSNGAEQIAVRARDAGFEVIYQGIRLTPARSSRRRGRGGRALCRLVHPVRRASRAGPRQYSTGCGRPAPATCRWWSAASFPSPMRPKLRRLGRRGRIYPEGLRPDCGDRADRGGDPASTRACFVDPGRRPGWRA